MSPFYVPRSRSDLKEEESLQGEESLLNNTSPLGMGDMIITWWFLRKVYLEVIFVFCFAVLKTDESHVVMLFDM